MLNIQRFPEYGSALVRIAMSLVFIWFGFNQIFDPEAWLSWMPKFAFNLPVKAELIILSNGLMEVTFGLLLLFGLFTRVAAFFLALHLIPIILSVGYNDVAVRDAGLMLATLSVFLTGSGKWCIDMQLRERIINIPVVKLLYLFDAHVFRTENKN